MQHPHRSPSSNHRCHFKPSCDPLTERTRKKQSINITKSRNELESKCRHDSYTRKALCQLMNRENSPLPRTSSRNTGTTMQSEWWHVASRIPVRGKFEILGRGPHTIKLRCTGKSACRERKPKQYEKRWGITMAIPDNKCSSEGWLGRRSAKVGDPIDDMQP